jgi:predicted ATP-binding protein involved in virulence
MYIKSLSITGLRCFAEKVEMQFQYPGLEKGSTYYPNINVLLGDNGTGKSTILQAIALACLGPTIESSGITPFFFIAQGMGIEKAITSARIVLHEEDSHENVNEVKTPIATAQIIRQGKSELLRRGPGQPTKISQWMNDAETETSPAFLFLGYGATRRAERWDYYPSSGRRERSLRYRRVASLFEDYVPLQPVEWLAQIFEKKPKRFDEINRIFKTLLPKDQFTRMNFKGNILFFEQGSNNLPFSALSDGYRSFISWVLDMLFYLTEVCPPEKKLDSLRGIVLVDEIDLHLHPSWQMVILEKISTTFPNLQFVITTHSEIVAGTLDNQSIYHMEHSKSNRSSEIKQLKSQIFGLNADQILRSEYFGLESTRAPRFQEELKDTAQKASQGDDNAAVEFMRKLAEGGNP